MKFVFKHWEWSIVLILIGWYSVWLIGKKITESKIPRNKEVVTMPPAEIEIYSEPNSSNTESYSYTVRTDSYGIKNLDRSDSVAIINLISNHFRSSIDTISLERYRTYNAKYYENTIDFNSDVYHFHRPDRPLSREAENYNAFVCDIKYYNGKLQSLRWYPDGEQSHYIIIARNDNGLLSGQKYLPLTSLIENKFNKFEKGKF